ncbi:hypothetical protein SLS60_006708 [Paraconiothyrium brasiliense]|uniref:MARVEL domain-containing protein n=1 Tax=Paraconiothyrium brasiliense TaxID=300254 RepID=A0ABR3RBI8_9PLEO
MSTSTTSYDPHRRPYDGPADSPTDTKRDQTGLLTRFVPDKVKYGKSYRWFLRFTHVFQVLSCVTSFGGFSQRLYKVYRLVNLIKTRRSVTGSFGAVEGILAAAVLYTISTMLLGWINKTANAGGRLVRWLWVLLDVLFVGAFIAVTALTRSSGELADPKYCYNPSSLSGNNGGDITSPTASRDETCNLVWGTFILAIAST